MSLYNSECDISDEVFIEILEIDLHEQDILLDLFDRKDDDEDDDDFDDDDDEEEEEDKPNKQIKKESQTARQSKDLKNEEVSEAVTKSSKLKWIIAILLVLVAAVAGAYFFLSSNVKPQNELKDPKVVKSGPPIYVKFPQEEIVAIVADANNQNHHVVVQVVLLTRDANIQSTLENNSALIISEFLELMEIQNYEELLTYDGKVELRQTMLSHLKKSIPDYGSNIEAVLITKFLMD